MSPEPYPNILRLYICSNVWWHPAGIQPVPVCWCRCRARNAQPQRNCPNTSPSAVSPLSCRDEITSHGFIYLSYRAPDRHLASVLSCASPPHPHPPAALKLGKCSANYSGNLHKEDEEEGKKGWTKSPTYSSLITSFFCLQEAPAIHLLPVLGPESLRVA